PCRPLGVPQAQHRVPGRRAGHRGERKPHCDREPARHTPPAAARGDQPGTMKILLVDDSQRLLRSLSQVLRKFGYAVDLASDGQPGLDLPDAYAYHVIVLAP